MKNEVVGENRDRHEVNSVIFSETNKFETNQNNVIGTKMIIKPKIGADFNTNHSCTVKYQVAS